MRVRTTAPPRLICRYARPHRTALGPHTIPVPTTRFTDDDLLLFLLVSTWELHTARPAPPVPFREMSEEELLAYWSDPFDDSDEGADPAEPSEPSELKGSSEPKESSR